MFLQWAIKTSTLTYMSKLAAPYSRRVSNLRTTRPNRSSLTTFNALKMLPYLFENKILSLIEFTIIHFAKALFRTPHNALGILSLY